jgi:hypothetical protein
LKGQIFKKIKLHFPKIPTQKAQGIFLEVTLHLTLLGMEFYLSRYLKIFSANTPSKIEKKTYLKRRFHLLSFPISLDLGGQNDLTKNRVDENLHSVNVFQAVSVLKHLTRP